MPIIPPHILLEAYQSGYFPMGLGQQADAEEIGWFEPKRRGILPLDRFHIPHGLRRTLKKGGFEIRFDTAFPEVMRRCAARQETWINAAILESYEALFHIGHAHSVEAWRDGQLAGGLYGVHIGAAFFGESMFHEVTDASKVALSALVDRLRAQKFLLLDTQWLTPHLAQFGGVELSRREYRIRLREAVRQERRFSPAPWPFKTESDG